MNANIVDSLMAGQQVLWWGILILGLEFSFLAFRLREEKIFLVLGVNLLILTFMVGIDIWILDPFCTLKINSQKFLELWSEVFHAFACCFLALLIWQTKILVNRPSKAFALIHTICLGVLGIVFVADGLLPGSLFITYREWKVYSTWVYDWLFTPYAIGIILFNIYLTIRFIPKAPLHLRKALKFLSFGYLFLTLGGMADMAIVIFSSSYYNAVSFSQFGILTVGIVGIFIFTDKMLSLFSQQEAWLLKIDHINGVITQNSVIKQLGISATAVSMEILKQVSLLKKDALKLLGQPDSVHFKGSDRIEKARNNLEMFTNRLLEFSACSRLGNLGPTLLSTVIESVLEKLPLEIRKRISVTGRCDELIPIDASKLVKAFFEIVKNSFEAKSDKISITISVGLGMVSIAIEDNGQGFKQGLTGKIVTPFFTSRKDEGAIGLGASIAEGVIRSHGGCLRFYSNSKLTEMKKGLFVNVLLPLYDKERLNAEKDEKRCLLVSDRNDLINEVLSICGNINIKLSVFGKRNKVKPEDLILTGSADLIILDIPVPERRVWDIDRNCVYGLENNALLPLKVKDNHGFNGNFRLCEDSLIRILAA